MHTPDPGPGVATKLAELSREARWLARVAGRLIPDPALAEDACQDTWLQTHRKDGGGVPTRGELLKGMRGFASVARRGERRRRDRERLAAREERLPSAAEIAARDEQIERMWEAVAELKEPLRSTLVMHYRHEATTAEIAERLELAQDTVRWRLRKAVAELRSRLDRDHAGGGLAALAVLVPQQALPASTVAAGAASGAALAAGSFSIHKLLLGVVTVVAATALLWLGLSEPTTLQPSSGEGPEASPMAGIAPLPAEPPLADASDLATIAETGTRESTDPATSSMGLAAEPWTLRAVDEHGRPVDGAGVYLAYRERTLVRRQLGVTDADGRFSTEDWPERPISLWTEKAGWQNGFVDLQRRREQDRDLGQLEMLPAAALYARIVDEVGRGVAGAVLFAERPDELAGQWGLPPGREDWRMTEEDGSLAWPNLSPETRRFWIHTNRHRARVVTWDGASEGKSPGSPVVWRVIDGEVLRGRVEGLPMEAPDSADEERTFKVVASLVGSTFGNADFLGGPTSGFFSHGSWSVVDDDGSFTLRGLHPGATYRLCMEERAPWHTVFSETLGVMDAYSLCEPTNVEAEAGDVVLHWRRPASLTFRVAVAGGGDVPAGLRVSSRDQALAAALLRHGAFTPDESGRCTVTTLPTGRGRPTLSVDAPGYRSVSAEFEPLESGDEVDLGVLELRPVPQVPVLVKDATTASPVKGAAVYTSAEVRSAAATGRPAIGTTNAAGRASLEYYESSTHSVSVRHPEFAERVLTGQVLKPGQQLAVELSRGGEAVVLAGLEEAGQRILCKPISGEAALGPTVRRSNNLASLRIESGETDADGRAVFDHLVPGEYEFFLFDAELTIAESSRLMSPLQRAGSVRAFVDDGATTTVDLGRAQVVTLEGTLTMDGAPLAGATVSLFDPVGQAGESLRILQQSHRIPTAESGLDGRYRLEHSQMGEFVLVIQSDRCVLVQEEPVVLDARTNRLDADLTRCVVKGHVVDSTGAPVPDQVVLVSLRREKTDPPPPLQAYSSHRVRTGADGRFELLGLPPGVPFSVQSHGRGWQGAYFGLLPLEQGEVCEGVELVTDRSADLTIRVARTPEDLRRFAIELRLIEAFAEGDPTRKRFHTQRRVVGIRGGTQSGTAQDLTPGRYIVEWKDAGQVVASKEVDVLLDVDNRVALEE